MSKEKWAEAVNVAVQAGIIIDEINAVNYFLGGRMSEYQIETDSEGEVIRSKLTQDEYIGYVFGNVVKYSSRVIKGKGFTQRDAEKLQKYSALFVCVMKGWQKDSERDDLADKKEG